MQRSSSTKAEKGNEQLSGDKQWQVVTFPKAKKINKRNIEVNNAASLGINIKLIEASTGKCLKSKNFKCKELSKLSFYIPQTILNYQ